jgi:chromosome segregation ATPase
VAQLKSGKIPDDAAAGARAMVLETVRELQECALEMQERASVLSGQARTMRDRMEREAQLKKSVHGRMTKLQEEMSGLGAHIGELRNYAGSVATRMDRIETRNRLLKKEYDELRKRGMTLAQDLKQSQTLLTQCFERIAQAESVARGVRAHERAIKGIMGNSSVINVNNSILGSKKELTPADVMNITENITQLLSQFERTYQFVEQSVGELEDGMVALADDLRQNLDYCSRLVSEEQDLLKGVGDVRKAADSASEDHLELSKELVALRGMTTRIGSEIQMVESKISHLVQIGQASLTLQAQLEIGFRNLSDRAEPASTDDVPDIGTA